MPNPIEFSIAGALGRVHLNSPSTFNALTREMCVAFRAKLLEWADDPVIGSTMNLCVDHTTTGHTSAVIHATDAPANVTLGGGQVVLIGGTQLFTLGHLAGPVAEFSISVPNEVSIAGMMLYTQAVHVFGVTPFALSNALDLTGGF